MAAQPLPPPSPDEEEGGGPVKPFLEHLEDLRWTIIKVVSALVLSMIVCLVAGNRLVHLLYWPLQRAEQLNKDRPADTTVSVRWGETVWGNLSLSAIGTNFHRDGHPPTGFLLKPTVVGTNIFVTLEPETNRVLQSNPGIVVLKSYGPISAIKVALKISLYGGLSLAAPFVMLFIGQFVLPALRTHEKRFVYRALAVGIGLFLIGIVFAYFVIMQITLLATVQFAQWLGFGADEWRADEYVDFVLRMILAVGLSFQLPVVLLTMVKIGIIDYESLVKHRAYFVVGNMIACAFITPSGDPFTMLLLAVPVQFLYELSVFISGIWWRREQREIAAMEAANGSA